MTQQRVLWLGILLAQAISLGAVSRTVAFPLLIGIAAILGAPGWFARPVQQRTKVILWILLAVVLTVKWRIFPLARREMTAVFPSDYSLMHAIAQGLLLAQVLEYYVPGPVSRTRVGRPAYGWMFCAIATMVCMFDFIALDRTNRITLALSAVFSALFLPYLAVVRRESKGGRVGWLRVTALSILLATGITAGSAGSLYLYHKIMSLDRVIAALFLPPLVDVSGFSSRATLDSVEQRRNDGAKKIMLRVKSENQPGHLRALAYERFTGKEWTRPLATATCRPSREAPADLVSDDSTNNFFRLTGPSSGPWRAMDVWADASLRDVVFKPLATEWVGAQVDTLSVDENLAISGAGLPPRQPYRVADTPALVQQELSDDMRARYTAVLGGLDPRIQALADSVTANQTTARQKAQAVERYFRENYEYSTGITIPPGYDPLTYFLIERPAAHCEFFAAGATTLLRLAGVPCRYVTGFVVTERNPAGGYWIARNRDAHAWAEAWDDATGWFTVDATPGAGAEQQGGSQLAYLWDAARFRFSSITASLRASIVAFFVGLGRRIPALLPIFVAGGALAVAVVVYRRLRRRPRKRAVPVPAEVVRMRRLLRTVDSRVRAKGYHRSRTETLHQFAQRIAAIAGLAPFSQWYRSYARARYGGSVTAQEVGQLEEEMRPLLRTGKR